MRRLLGLAVLAAAASIAGGAHAEKLTIALSTPEVKINSNFTGTTITIFGVIERDASTVSRAGYEVAVVIRGPPETVVARRKDRVLVVWANGASETITAPSFYAAATSRALATTAPPQLLNRLGVGFDYLPFAYEGTVRARDAGATEFRDAYLRLQQQAGLYTEQIGGVSFIGESVFRAGVRIPANVPTGAYTVAVYLFSGGALLAATEDTISITKTGFEQFMFAAAHDHAPAYALACVALALFTGWLAGVIFRRD